MRRNNNAKEHVKLYKSKKNWVAATIFTTALGITGVSAVSNASANSVSSSSSAVNLVSSSQVESSSAKSSNTVTLRSSSTANSSSTTSKSSSAQSLSVASQKASLQNQINQKKQDLNKEQSQQSSLQAQYKKDSQTAQQIQGRVNYAKSLVTQAESKMSSLSSQKSNIQNQINNLSNNSMTSAQQAVNDAQSKLDNVNQAVQQAQNKLDADKKKQGQLGTPWLSNNPNNNGEQNGNKWVPGVVGTATKEQEAEWDNGVHVDADVQSILDQLNLQRIAHGVAPVKLDADLEKTAQWRVSPENNNSLMKNFNHTNEGSTTAFNHGYMSAAENIAQGFDPDQCVNGWNSEPTHAFDHRMNDFDPAYTNVGIAYYNGYAVIDFAGHGFIAGYNGLDDDQIWKGENSVTPVSMITNIQQIQQDKDELNNAKNNQEKAQENLANAQNKLNEIQENNKNQIENLKNNLDDINKQLFSTSVEFQDEKKLTKIFKIKIKLLLIN